METNKPGQRECYQEVERTLVKLVEEIESIEDGNLKELEQKIYKGVLELGRQLFQCRINQSGEKVPGKRVGECGHDQHVVDYRTKQILTMMGKVEFQRAYYQCQGEKEQPGEQGDQQQRCPGRAGKYPTKWVNLARKCGTLPSILDKTAFHQVHLLSNL